MLYERTAISRKPEKLIKQELDALREENKLTPDLVFRDPSRDPYILDFLRLKDSYSEKDLEAAILREMEIDDCNKVRRVVRGVASPWGRPWGRSVGSRLHITQNM